MRNARFLNIIVTFHSWAFFLHLVDNSIGINKWKFWWNEKANAKHSEHDDERIGSKTKTALNTIELLKLTIEQKQRHFDSERW